MTKTESRDVDPRRVRPHVAAAKRPVDLSARLSAVSAAFLDAPYVANGLVGSATTPERFTASLEGFDCVTYLETVLALSRAKRAVRFAEELRLIRYHGGRVAWRRRNHYMTDWARRNTRAGIVRPVAAALGTPKERTLDAVPGLPPKRARFTCVPKSKMARLAPLLKTGDLVFFASTKPGLDVFHSGVLVNDGGVLKLRHASRSRGRVVEEELAEFLKKNRMAGLIVVRPVDPGEAETSEPRRAVRPRKAKG